MQFLTGYCCVGGSKRCRLGQFSKHRPGIKETTVDERLIWVVKWLQTRLYFLGLGKLTL
jgi:hypothetical protein